MARRTPTPDSTSASRSPDASAGRANPLNLRQMRFVAAYLKTGNATAAAKLAGYSESSAAGQGARMLRNEHIRAAVTRSGQKAVGKAEITAEWVLSRLRSMAAKTTAKDADRIRALELLGKNLVLFTEKVEHSGSLAVTVSTDVPESDPE